MDDFEKFFRGFFSFPPHNHRRGDDDLNEPGEHEWTDPFFSNRGNSGDDFDRMFEHFHGDMWQQMESLHRQMEDMIRGFGGVRFPSDFQPPRIEAPPEIPTVEKPIDDQPSNNGIRIWFGSPSPFFHQGAERREKKSPREFMLKEDVPDNEDRSVRPALPAPSEPSHDDLKRPFKFFSFPELFSRRQDKDNIVKKGDTDLDGKLSDKEVLDLITKKAAPHSQPSPPAEPRRSSWGTSVSVTRVLKPDGTVEEKRIVRDSSGHEESTVTKTKGDQSYTVTTITGENGKIETKETFQNMDEKDKDKFEQGPLLKPQPPALIDTQDRDIFSKLFEWRGK